MRLSQKFFQVFSIDWRDDEAMNVAAWDANDACHEWCKGKEGCGSFSDGYPDMHELRVVAPDGTETRHLVSTDWDPVYYVSSKPSEAALKGEGG